MKSLRHIFLYCIIFFNNAPLASEIDNSYQKQSLLAVLFKRTSAEYKANTIQIYMLRLLGFIGKIKASGEPFC